MATSFSKTFMRLRREAGFATAYAFFHRNGGQSAFRCTFPNYLRIEKGAHLPRPERLPKLCALLRLPLGGAQMRELVDAYLESWLGSRRLLDWMLAPFARPGEPAAPLDPAQQALSRIVRGSGRPVSTAQFRTIMGSAANYWCHRILTTSREACAPAALARLLGLRPAAVKRALAALTRARLARRGKDGRYLSPLAGQFLVFPDSSLLPPRLLDRAFVYNQAMLKKRGKLVDVRYCGVRADARQIEGFIPHFREAIRGVNAYALTEKTEQSGLFFVEGRVYKLMDF